MKTADLPTKKAQKPQEGAKMPFIKPSSNKHIKGRNENKKAANDENNNENLSQNSYNDMLSQPASQMTHREKMLWLQKRRTNGLWVQCDDCDRWRFLAYVQDRHYLPNKWYCKLNPDVFMANCSVPEAPFKVHDEKDLIHSEYSIGSVVWARVDGYPWWPAMIDDCPDTEQFYWIDGFSDIPIYYNVVFFDSSEVTRAWISTNNIISYHNNRNKIHKLLVQNKKFASRLLLAATHADEAEKMPLTDRLEQFSFITRYPGKINSPAKVGKKLLMKFYKKFQKQFYIDLDEEIISTDSDEGDTIMDIKIKKRTNNINRKDKSKQVKPKISDKNLTQATFDAPADKDDNSTIANTTDENIDQTNDSSETTCYGDTTTNNHNSVIDSCTDSGEGDTNMDIKNKKRPNNGKDISKPKKAKIINKNLTRATFNAPANKDDNSTIADSTNKNIGQINESTETMCYGDTTANCVKENSVEIPAPTQDSFRTRTESAGSDDFDF